MIRTKQKLIPSILTSCIPLTALANANPTHMVVAPSCLINKMHASYQTITSTKKLMLVGVNSDGIQELIDLKAKSENGTCGGFMDVTEKWTANKSGLKAVSAKSFLTKYEKPQQIKFKSAFKVNHEVEVTQLLTQMNPQDMWTDLNTLSTTFANRNAYFNNGVAASDWIQEKIKTMVTESKRKDVTISTVKTGLLYNQPSIVVKIGDANAPGIVIGGHMDAAPSLFGNRPGADDDGSGTVTVLELARLLIGSGMQFEKPIYLIWYAAEEEGLVGSQKVVADFEQNDIPVDAVLQLDMTGYAYKNEPTMYLITDNVDAELTNYLKVLIEKYVKKPVAETECGYACSDHASWTDEGFRSAAPTEATKANLNPAYHSSNDTIDKLSLSHMTDYATLAVAFAVEGAVPKTVKK